MEGRTVAWLLAASLLLAPAGAEAVGSPSPELACLQPAADAASFHEAPASFESGNVTLAGRLFLPAGPGPHPAVVLLHGGGYKRLNQAPLFYAPLLARCGVAALVYDKRGTGASEGVWEAADFDDFVADAVAAVGFVQQQPGIDARQVGVIGFSQGGQLAPAVAIRHGEVAFVVSVSAPFTSVVETRLYALEQWLRRRGVLGEALQEAMELWRRHLDAVARDDPRGLARLDRQIRAASRRPGGVVLPPTSDRLPHTPTYNSMGGDFTRRLRHLRAPLLAVYGERDTVVPVARSVAALQQVLAEGGHRNADVIVVPFADHSFNDLTFNQRIRIEETILSWILTRLEQGAALRSDAATTQ